MLEGKRVILSVQEYDFTTDEGERVEGANAYIISDPLTSEGARGYKVGKVRLDKALLRKLDNKPIPGVVNCKFQLSVDRQQKTSLSLLDLEYDKEFKLNI